MKGVWIDEKYTETCIFEVTRKTFSAILLLGDTLLWNVQGNLDFVYTQTRPKMVEKLAALRFLTVIYKKYKFVPPLNQGIFPSVQGDLHNFSLADKIR